MRRERLVQDQPGRFNVKCKRPTIELGGGGGGILSPWRPSGESRLVLLSGHRRTCVPLVRERTWRRGQTMTLGQSPSLS